jgi:hypothetical protein
MRKAFLSLAAAAMALGVLALPVSSASAVSSPTLVCNIQPSGTTVFSSVCSSSYAAAHYGVTFEVQGGSGTYSYAWTLPSMGSWGAIYSGCTSTSSVCELLIRGTPTERDMFVSVVLTQGGTQTTLTDEAFVPGVCGSQLC